VKRRTKKAALWAESRGRRDLVFIVLVFLLTAVPETLAQSVSIDGYVRTEAIYDTRQVLQVRDGEFHLYPLPASAASAANNFLMASFQSRVGISTSPDSILNGEMKARVEADFFGSSDANLSTLRLRIAFVTWTSGKNELLVGQFWSPMFTLDVYPRVVGFATGAPFQPFARFPQVRFTRELSNLNVELAITSQRDAYAEIGGGKLQHQSGKPALHLHLVSRKNEVVWGVGGTSKTVRPDPASGSFSARAATAYASWNPGNTLVRLKGVWGEDLADHLMTGGFVTASGGSAVPMSLISTWMDVSHKFGRWAPGLFIGYLTNQGSRIGTLEEIQSSNARAENMVNLFRIAPRVFFNEKNLKLAVEVELTSALYGDSYNSRHRPLATLDQQRVANVRTLITASYQF